MILQELQIAHQLVEIVAYKVVKLIGLDLGRCRGKYQIIQIICWGAIVADLKVHEERFLDLAKGIVQEHNIIVPTIAMIEHIELPRGHLLILQQAVDQILIAIRLQMRERQSRKMN